MNPYPKIIPYARQSIDELDIQAVTEVLRSEYVTQGPRVGWFEDGLKEVVGVDHAVVVSSGTAALHLSCLGLGLGPGDRGIVPAITFAATANCLLYCGASVSFSDVSPETGLATEKDFSEAIERANAEGDCVRALFPVSYSGLPPDLEGIQTLARSKGAFVVEDAAHSLGARYATGTGVAYRSGACAHSDAAILSFHPVKHICAGEGGAVLTNDSVLAAKVRRLRSHGIERTENVIGKSGPWAYDQSELGYHYRMTELQAAIGRSQLAKLDTFIEKRRTLVDRYFDAFESGPFCRAFDLPERNPNASWHLFVIRFRSARMRRAAYDFLVEMNVRPQVHYIPVYRHTHHRDEASRERLTGSEEFYSGCLSLPMYPGLADEEQSYVIEALREFCERNDG